MELGYVVIGYTLSSYAFSKNLAAAQDRVALDFQNDIWFTLAVL